MACSRETGVNRSLGKTMIRRLYLITFIALSGLSIYLATDLMGHQSMVGYDGRDRAESLLLGFTVGLLAILVGFVCKLWLQRTLESTRIENRFSRGPISQIHQLDSALQVVAMDDTRVLAMHGEALEWRKEEYMEERVWEDITKPQESFEGIR
jgi:hypothetical protein